MPNAKFIQSNFTAGEVSPRLLARVDFAKHKNGCQVLKNYLPLVHGGADSRAGTRMAAETKTSSKTSILVPFEFSTVQAYVLEFGDQYLRFYKDGGRIESPPGTPVEIATPYLEADLGTLKFAQSADTLYIVHRSYAPRKLTRTSHTAWALNTIVFTDGPYLDENTDATSLMTCGSNTVGASTTLTSSGATAFQFTANHVGAYFRLKGNTTYGYVKVTGFTNANNVTVTVMSTLDFATPGTTTTKFWREGAWSTAQGFPGAITIFEQRLVFASTNQKPQTVWGSLSGSYEDFTPGTTDSSPVTFTIGSNRVNVIRWLVGTSQIVAGSVGEEFVLGGGNSAALTPSNVKASSQTTHGSKDIQAVRVADSTVFVQRSGKKVRQLAYSIQTNSLTANDLTLLSEHITGTGVTRLAYQQEPDSVLWAVRADGVLLSCTFLPVQEVIGWARHITDGSFESAAVIPSTDGTSDTAWLIVKRTVGGVTKRYVEYFDPALAVDSGLSYSGVITVSTLTPGATTGTGVTFTASAATFVAGDVGKQIVFTDGSSFARATITGYTSATQVTADIVNAFPSTSAIAAGSWGLAVSTVSGLSHLEGKTVQIVGDGAVYPEKVVTAGAVTLDGMKAARIDVGLGFTPSLTTLEPEITGKDGDTIQGVKKRFAEFYVRVYQTTGVWINGTEEEPARSTADLMGVAPAAYTGDVKCTQLGFEDRAVMTIEQRLPLKSTILAIWGTLDYGD